MTGCLAHETEEAPVGDVQSLWSVMTASGGLLEIE